MTTMHSVISSNITKIGYDTLSQTLFVQFKNGNKYSYDNVPEEVYEELDSASSVGGYFSQNIRNSYTYHKI